MYRTEDEKWADIKLGEATLSLLTEGAEVSEATLLLRLQQMAMSETNNTDRAATYAAIREVAAALCTQASAGSAGYASACAELSGLAGLTPHGTKFLH
ncbi:hypothetical protein [Pantoea agglomerans]|uniref:hypothetical protein n=1 Tax=Enterobacter agglomerans TaxID=549 RepID=UPI000E21412C